MLQTPPDECNEPGGEAQGEHDRQNQAECGDGCDQEGADESVLPL